MQRPYLVWRLAVVLATAAITACSGTTAPAPTSSRPASPHPTTSSRLVRPGFVTAVPVGWTESHDPSVWAAIRAPGPVLVVLTKPPSSPVPQLSDVQATLVITTVAAGPVPADALAGYLNNSANDGARNLTSPYSVTVDGESGLAVTYEHDIAGTRGRALDLVVTHEGISYEVVEDTAASRFDDDRGAVNSLISTWHWTSPSKR